MIDYAARRFREEVTRVARRRVRGRRVRRPRPARQPRRPPAREDHRRRRATSRSTTPARDTRQELQAWSTFGNTRGYTVGADRVDDGPGDPQERGLLRPDQARRARRAACSTRTPGKPVSAGTHHPGADVGEVIAVAMQHVLPDKAVPQTYKTGIPTIIVGIDPRTGQPFTDHSAEVYAGWCNAAKGMDAWGAQNASVRQPLEGDRRDQREPLPARPVEPRLPHRLRRPGPVARPLRQPLREGGARRREGLHVRRRHEVPDARHLRRQARRAERDGDPLRLRRPVRRQAHRGLGADRRPASGSCTTTAAAAVGATRSTATRRPCSTTCSTST